MKTRTLKILAVSLGLCAATGNLAAQVTLTNLYSFIGNPITSGVGAIPVAGLVQGSDGNFYGTTEEGGAKNEGTVFRISPSGSLTTLWTFDLDLIPADGDFDGVLPQAGVVQGGDGNFYGTTYRGGTNGGVGGGVVFQISMSGSLTTLTTLHTFNDPRYPNDGIEPEAGLVQGNDGYFYGTTTIGGTYNGGSIYRVNSNGSSYGILYSFTNEPAQAMPRAGLVQGSDGNFYGITTFGGTNGNGTIFELNTTNDSLTTLHTFEYNGVNNFDGYTPQAGLVQGNDGNFYGTTYYGGTNGTGTVFRINPTGSNYAILYSFNSYTGDGKEPDAGLVLGSDGNFYGTTYQGGAHSGGTVFRISPSGSYSNLYSFLGNVSNSDGDEPAAGLVQGIDGNFYGTTELGGTNGHGNVFKLIVPLNPPANQISAIQVAGTNVLVTLPSVAAEMYQLQYRTSLTAGAWADVEGQVTSIGGSLTVTNFGGFSQSQQYYRFAITP
jgi:uncharacterized repeat protein (TIGR03803 family)